MKGGLNHREHVLLNHIQPYSSELSAFCGCFFAKPRSGKGFHMPDEGATELGPCSAKTWGIPSSIILVEPCGTKQAFKLTTSIIIYLHPSIGNQFTQNNSGLFNYCKMVTFLCFGCFGPHLKNQGHLVLFGMNTNFSPEATIPTYKQLKAAFRRGIS